MGQTEAHGKGGMEVEGRDIHWAHVPETKNSGYAVCPSEAVNPLYATVGLRNSLHTQPMSYEVKNMPFYWSETVGL